MNELWPEAEDPLGDTELWRAWERFERAHPEATRQTLGNFAREIMQEMDQTGESGPIRDRLVQRMEDSALEVMAGDILLAIHDLPETDELAEAG